MAMAIKKVAVDVCQKLESVEEGEGEEGGEGERYDGPPPTRYDGPTPPIPSYYSQK